MQFQGLLVDKRNGNFFVEEKTFSINDLPEGDVLIRTAYSGINYKDGLALTPEGKVVRSYPMIPGIDLSGTVVQSSHPRFRPGDAVLVTGYELGVSHFGGFSEYARVPGDWCVPLPEGLSPREAMIYGTAGFTAALAIHRLEQNGMEPGKGTILVTGATGGVGSLSVAMLAKLGYRVAASTGKKEEHEYLRALGAAEVLTREDVNPPAVRPLERERWAGAIDAVGGKTLSYILSSTQRGGCVASCGLAGGSELSSTVFPFILRGVQLIGIDSVYCPKDLRESLWKRLAQTLKPVRLEDHVAAEISLSDIPKYAENVLKGAVRGRVLIRL